MGATFQLKFYAGGRDLDFSSGNFEGFERKGKSVMASFWAKKKKTHDPVLMEGVERWDKEGFAECFDLFTAKSQDILLQIKLRFGFMERRLTCFD